MWSRIIESLQSLGRALMGAVAVLPVAAILMGVGYWIDPSGWGANNVVAAVLIKSGGAVLDNLGWIFAVAIAFGLAKDHNGASALAGFIGFATVKLLLSPAAVAGYKGIDDPTKLTGDAALRWASQGWDAINDKNVLIGILVGVLAAWTYNHFHSTVLPDFLAFFSGRRLVPILTSLFSILLAGALFVLWPWVFSGLFAFGQAISGMGALGAGIYGVMNRLLIPTGLHHALNSIFWFDVIGINDIGKFLAGGQTIAAAEAAKSALDCPGIWDGTTCTVIGEVGRYQAGFFPIMMFGVPGAALAIYLRADTKQKKATGALMLAGALASMFTGVTEPIEFSFMFLAPVLYLVHALLTGLSMFIAATFHWTAGFGFSAGLVDMVLSARNPLSQQWWMLLVMGVVFFFIYLGVFYALIGWMNLKTPGRGTDAVDATADPTGESGSSASDDEPSTQTSGLSENAIMARSIVSALGGPSNITSMDYCATRLRGTVADRTLVNQDAIRRAGAAGVVQPSDHAVQVVIGPKVQFVYDEVADQLEHSSVSLEGEKDPAAENLPPVDTSTLAAGTSSSAADKPAAGTRSGAQVEIHPTFQGEVVKLEDVDDPVFSQGILGEGFAVLPDDSASTIEVCAPVAGTVTKLFATGHAFVVTSEDGLDVLVHIGLDTVNLKGEGFTALVGEGDAVAAGTPIMRVDLGVVRAAGYSPVTPVVFTEKKQVASVGEVRVGAAGPADIATMVTLA